MHIFAALAAILIIAIIIINAILVFTLNLTIIATNAYLRLLRHDRLVFRTQVAIYAIIRVGSHTVVEQRLLA